MQAARGAHRPAVCITLAAMHFDTLTAPEQRVLGCLIEKRFTTPDQYPLSLNALRLACNQSTNRDPVVNYDEETVREAAQRLSKYGLARLASGHTSRATKYRHLAEEALGLNREQLAILSVLLLRGPQTPGELKTRSERVVSWPSLGAVDQVLAELGERGYAQRLERRPGQKEDRFTQLLGGAPDGGAATPAVPPPMAQTPAVPPPVAQTPAVPPPVAQTPSATGADGVGTAGEVSRVDGRELFTRLNALEQRVAELEARLSERA